MRIILGLLLLLSFSKMAAAYSCTTSVPTSIRSIPDMNIPRDAPVGSILGAAFQEITPFNCVNDSPGLTYQEFGVKAYGTYVMMISNRRVYSTNLPGIGYSVYSLTPACTGTVGVSVDGTNTLAVTRIPDYCAKPMDRFHQPTCPVPRGLYFTKQGPSLPEW